MKAELLSPAGSFESLKAAVNAGADAVYLGGRVFGARAFAANLSDEELLEAIDYVHIHGKRMYLTLNTLFKEKEIKKDLYNYLLPLYEMGLDAVIVQDLGVVKFLKSYFPDLTIHGSTQMAIMNSYGVEVLEDLGISRVVTARELSLKELSEIKKNTNIEIESFIHGALCYGYSGMCLFSSMLGGRSGNRGRCAQPCRLPYTTLKNNKSISEKNEQYILSPKDICTLDILPEIIEAGVYSLKIEGRMKSVEYTAGVTAIYRKYLDLLFEKGIENYRVDKDDLNTLVELYSRGGKSSGYYKQHNARKMITLTKPGYVSKNTDPLDNINKERGVNCNISIIRNAPAEITLYDEKNHISVQGDIPSESINKPLTKEVLLKQINKTGGTEFSLENINITLEDGLFLTIKSLNELRRKVLEKFKNEIIKDYIRKAKIDYKFEEKNQISNNSMIKINCYVEEIKQFNAILTVKEIDSIYIDYSCIELSDIDEYVRDAHENNKKLYLALPPIFRKAASDLFDSYIHILRKSSLDGYLVKNIDEIGYFKKKDNKALIFDHSIYALNNEAKSMLYYWEPDYTTLPLELNYGEMKARGCQGEEIVGYGHLPLMVSAGCLKKTLNSCNNKDERLYLNDRYNKKFMVKNNCALCYNTVYNSDPLSLLDVSSEIKKLQLRSIRLNFTNEDSKNTLKILNDFINVYTNGKSDYKELETFTRGHFKRGIE